MRTKFAREIRAGILLAKQDLRFFKDYGRMPLAMGRRLTPLGEKAYDKVVNTYLVNELRASVIRMVESMARAAWALGKTEKEDNG